jgi:hypothetical protein
MAAATTAKAAAATMADQGEEMAGIRGRGFGAAQDLCLSRLLRDRRDHQATEKGCDCHCNKATSHDFFLLVPDASQGAWARAAWARMAPAAVE